MSGNEAQIASKTQKQVFDLLEQSITEFGIRAKEHKIEALIKYQEKMSGPMQLLQQDVTRHPDHYHVLYLEHGKADDLKAFFKNHDVAYLEMEPSIIERNAGGFIISDTDYKMIKDDPQLHITHRYTQEQLKEHDLDENGQTEAERTEEEEKKKHERDENDDEHDFDDEEKSQEQGSTSDKTNATHDKTDATDQNVHDDTKQEDKEEPADQKTDAEQTVSEDTENTKADGSDKQETKHDESDVDLKSDLETEADSASDKNELLEETKNEDLNETLETPESDLGDASDSQEEIDSEESTLKTESEPESIVEESTSEQETSDQEITHDNDDSWDEETDDSSNEEISDTEISEDTTDDNQYNASDDEIIEKPEPIEQEEVEQPVQEQFETSDDSSSQDYYEDQASSSDYEDQTNASEPGYEDTYETSDTSAPVEEVVQETHDDSYAEPETSDENSVYENNTYEQDTSLQYTYEDIPEVTPQQDTTDSFANAQEYQEQPTQDSSWTNTQQDNTATSYQFEDVETITRQQEQANGFDANLSNLADQNENQNQTQNTYPDNQTNIPTPNVDVQQQPQDGSVLTGSINSLAQEQAQEAANSPLESNLSRPENVSAYTPSLSQSNEIGKGFSQEGNIGSSFDQSFSGNNNSSDSSNASLANVFAGGGDGPNPLSQNPSINASAGSGDGPNPPSKNNLNSPSGGGLNPPDDRNENDKQNPPVVPPIGNIGARQTSIQSSQTQSGLSSPAFGNNDVYVSDDVLLDSHDGRSREMLDNAIYNATVGNGVEEAKGEGFKRTSQLVNSIAGGQGGLAGLKQMQSTLKETLSADDIRTISLLMKTHAAKTGMGGGLDFSSTDNIEKSFDDLNSFFNSIKLADSHSAMHLRASLAADAKMEYGRNKFGREGLRRADGSYVMQGDYTKNYEYAAKYFKQLQSERNKGLKSSDPNFLSDKQVEHLIKSLTDQDGKNVQKLLGSYESFKLGQNIAKGKGGQKLFSLNPLNNAAVKKALAEDETAQGLQKPQTVVSSTLQARKVGLTLSKMHGERQALSIAREQTATSAKIAELKKAGKVKTKEYQDAISRAKKLAADKKTALDNAGKATKKIKQQNEFGRTARTQLKKSITNHLNGSKAGKQVLARAAAVQKIRVDIIQRFQASLLGKMVKGFNALRQVVMTKLVAIGIKALGVLASFLLFVLKVLFILMLIGGLLDLITMFTLGNNRLEEDPAWGDIENSIMGNVYNQLTLSEGEWAHYLKYELFEIQNPVWLDELDGRYTAWLSDGSIDWDHFHMSTKDYITEIIGTDYAEQTIGWFGKKASIAKGPEPFPGAPEGSNTPDDPGAYKWIRLLDGSIEVRFRGVGNVAGRTSNIKEIMAMTAVAQMESDLVTEEIDEEGYAEIENASAWERLGSNLKKFWDQVTEVFTKINNAIQTGFEKLLRTIPAYDEWWQNQIAKEKTQTYMLYASPLFEYSHTEEYSLQLVIKPTLKTQEEWATLHPEEAIGDGGEVDTAYGWGTMCSGITDQARSAAYRRGHELNDEGTDYAGEHGGYGCMEFNEFAFKYDSDQDMYYNDVLAPQVKASWDVDNEEDICVAPGDNGIRWLQVTRDYGHDDCWTYVGIQDLGWQRTGPNSLYGHAEFIDNIAGYNKGYINISSGDGGNTYSVEVAQNTEERGTGTYHEEYDDRGFLHNVENTETWSYVVVYTWAHNCQGDHTGYYCGGHFNTIVTGCIYHMSVPELEYNESAFEEKYVDADKLRNYEEQVEALGYNLDDCYNEEGQLLRHFHLMYDNKTGEPFLVNYVGIQKEEPSNQAMDACRDLFDIDASYTHRYGHVNIQMSDTISTFFGWDYAAMNAAVTKLEDDWQQLYNIVPQETIGGTEGGIGSNKGLATALEKGQVVEALAALDEMYENDPSWPARRQAIETALQYVGKVAYSQKSHGTALGDGSLNDCSGYVSQCWKDVLQKNYTTASFYNTFHPGKWDNNIKPGDIILHYDGAVADGSGDHALIYIGKDPVTGQHMSVDCTGSGTHYRSRGDTYYKNAYYINMSEVMGH